MSEGTLFKTSRIIILIILSRYPVIAHEGLLFGNKRSRINFRKSALIGAELLPNSLLRKETWVIWNPLRCVSPTVTGSIRLLLKLLLSRRPLIIPFDWFLSCGAIILTFNLALSLDCSRNVNYLPHRGLRRLQRGFGTLK